MTLAASPKSARDRALLFWIASNAETGRNSLRSCAGEDAGIARTTPRQQIASRRQMRLADTGHSNKAAANFPRRKYAATRGALRPLRFRLLVDHRLRHPGERDVRLLLFLKQLV